MVGGGEGFKKRGPQGSPVSNEPIHICPVCDGKIRKSDLPRSDIYVCVECHEIMQFVGEEMTMIGSLLQRNALGDDRVRAAISQPHVSNLSSFIEVSESHTRLWQMNMAAASGGLRTILAQIENRIDGALTKLSGLDMVSDKASDGLAMLREARELVSTVPSRNRGVREANDDGKIRSEQQGGLAEEGTEASPGAVVEAQQPHAENCDPNAGD